MKIAIEAQRIFRKKKHGIEIVALEVIRELQKIDHENEYIIFARQDEDMGCLSETANFRIVPLPAANFAWWEQVLLPRAVKKYQPDLLHCTGNTAPVVHHARTLLTIHDIFFTSFSNLKGTPYQALGNLYRKIIFPHLASFDHLVTVSHTEKENIVKKLGIDPAKIDVIYNGVHPKFREINDKEALRTMQMKYMLPEKFVFFFANTAPKKNTVNVLKAFGELVRKDASYKLLITDSSGYYVRKCLKDLHLEWLENNLVIPGFIANDDLPYIYNLATIYLFPSLEESFGLPIAEAQACGTPVITSNVSAMPEIAGNSAMLTDPFSVNAIADSVNLLWNNEEQRTALSAAGLVNAKRFSWHDTATQLLQLYKKMA